MERSPLLKAQTASTSRRVLQLPDIVSHTVFQLDLDSGYYKDEKIFSYPCLNVMSTASCYSDTLSVPLSCSDTVHLENVLIFLIAVAGLAPNSGLLGTTPEDAALVDQWVHFAETELAVQNEVIVGMLRNRLPYNKLVSFLPTTRSFTLSDSLHAATHQPHRSPVTQP